MSPPAASAAGALHRLRHFAFALRGMAVRPSQGDWRYGKVVLNPPSFAPPPPESHVVPLSSAAGFLQSRRPSSGPTTSSVSLRPLGKPEGRPRSTRITSPVAVSGMLCAPADGMLVRLMRSTISSRLDSRSLPPFVLHV